MYSYMYNTLIQHYIYVFKTRESFPGKPIKGNSNQENRFFFIISKSKTKKSYLLNITYYYYYFYSCLSNKNKK